MSEKKEIGLAVVGCGTIGRIRAIMARDYPGIGWIGLCDINKELGGQANIILTGGFTSLMSPKLPHEHILDFNLTLDGIRIIYEENN